MKNILLNITKSGDSQEINNLGSAANENRILPYESISEQFSSPNVQLLLHCIKSLYTTGRQKEYLENKCSYEQINCRKSKQIILKPT